MSKSKQALLLVGSPRGLKSTSASLGQYLLGKLQNGGFKTEQLHVQQAMRSNEAQVHMLEQVGESDLLVLAFPLYIDSLPAPVITALELIAKQRKDAVSPKNQRFLAIVNNGFPEASQNSTAVAICRRFASEAGIEWAGGLSLGGGGAVAGNKLEDAGAMLRNVRKALDLAANDLLEGRAVSAEAVELMAKPLAPKWLYLFFGNREWKKMAKKYGAQNKLHSGQENSA
jgi:hypothetical protein